MVSVAIAAKTGPIIESGYLGRLGKLSRRQRAIWCTAMGHEYCQVPIGQRRQEYCQHLDVAFATWLHRTIRDLIEPRAHACLQHGEDFLKAPSIRVNIGFSAGGHQLNRTLLG